jgi:putative DNA primase/helicase
VNVANDDDWVAGYGEEAWPGPPADEPPDNVHLLPSAQAVEVSEDAIALAFTREFGGTMRYDHHAGRWYQWSLTHWRRLDVPAALHFAREIGRRLGSGKKAICKASVARGAETFAQADPTHAVTSEIWDKDPWLLGTPKGTLNLRTGKMHQPRPSDFITKMTGCNPDSRDPTLWLRFLGDATRGDQQMITYLQRVAGYCLTGLTAEHALFFIYGPGGNGKSVFLSLLLHILGDYATNAPMDTFTSSKFSAHPTELAMLKGARLVTASETEEGRAWAESRIKALTGGDPITARFMRQDFFTYQPQFKLLFAGNHQPTLHGVDAAMRRRFNMLPFIFKPEEPDPDLEDKLKEESSRILGWALKGCLDWQLHGLGRPAIVSAATDEYFEEQDLFGTWIEDRCEVDPNAWDTPALLFKSWSAYARESGEDAGSMVTFSSRLKRLGFRRGKSAGIRSYRGVRVRSGGSENG